MKNTKYSDLPIQAGPLFADLKTLTDGHTFKIEFNNYCIIPQVRLLCCNLFFLCEGAGGGGRGRMAGNVRPTVKLHTSRAQQDIKTGT